jgi:hypothetical protein
MAAPQLQLVVIKAAPEDDVLFDQLIFLMAHQQQGECSIQGCEACQRFRVIKHFLMKPFRQKAR